MNAVALRQLILVLFMVLVVLDFQKIWASMSKSAKAFIDDYLNTFPGIKDYMNQVVKRGS